MPVFARNPAGHRYDAALQQWRAHACCDHRAMAWNVMCDHRVTEAREGVFDSFVPATCTPRTLADALRRYKDARVRGTGTPDFAVEAINGDNIVSSGESGRHSIPRDAELARIVDLNGLTKFYEWAQSRSAGFDTVTRLSPDGIDQFLTQEIDGKDPEPLIRRVISGLNAYRKEGHYHPSWVTYWEDFRPHLNEGASRWARVVGVDIEAGHWVLVLRYPVRRAGTVARPTQLDAGWHANHFPSPPMVAPAVGGFAMDLHAVFARRLVPEFIHDQVDHELEDWTSAGRRLERTKPEPGCTLEEARERHHILLTSAYGSTVSNWMPRSH
jgi:hypothetical protein